MIRPCLVSLVTVLLFGCAAGGTPDAGGPVDSGSMSTDSGSVDSGSMMGTDSGSMMGTDSGSMMGTDSGAMPGDDAGSMSDAGTDAGFDAGTDAGFDAGLDAGFDAGSTAELDYPVGGRDRNWTTTRYFRGDIYEAYGSVTLRRFSAYLGLASSCTLGFYVFTSSSLSGPYTRAWSASVTSSGTAYHSSGPIDLAVSPGTFYTLGVGWDCSATYYSANYDTMTGVDGGIGYLRGNAYSNSYPGYSTGFTPSGSGAGGAHYQQIVTVSP